MTVQNPAALPRVVAEDLTDRTQEPHRPLPSDAATIAGSLVDPERFGQLYDRYAAMLYRFAVRRLGPTTAEDAVSDTFLAAFRHRGRYDLTRADARPWLFGILTHEIAGRRRAESTRLRLLAGLEPEPHHAGPEEQVPDAVTAQAAGGGLASALAQLNAGDRDVLLLIAWADLSYLEVADALAIPVGTVRSRLNRARRLVRQALGDQDPLNLQEEN
jgi:RNA polymerase sigma-70 factor (ECF subfamily)